jgi:RNA polymerase sigma-70 factor, ECF subfamily
MVENHVRSALVPLYPRLRRFAAALTGSLAEGDDLVQHACERALTRTYQWQPGTRLDS